MANLSRRVNVRLLPPSISTNVPLTVKVSPSSDLLTWLLFAAPSGLRVTLALVSTMNAGWLNSFTAASLPSASVPVAFNRQVPSVKLPTAPEETCTDQLPSDCTVPVSITGTMVIPTFERVTVIVRPVPMLEVPRMVNPVLSGSIAPTEPFCLSFRLRKRSAVSVLLKSSTVPFSPLVVRLLASTRLTSMLAVKRALRAKAVPVAVLPAWS